MDSKEVKDYVLNVVKEVFTTLSKEKQIEAQELNIRIDLQGLFSNPVFALYRKASFLCPSSLNEIVVAGGGKQYKMIVGVQIRGIVSKIFKAALKQFNLNDTKQMFVMLFIKVENEITMPMLGIYKQGQLVDEIPIGDIFEV